MLDVKGLSVLQQVAASGSFSAAAEALNYSQPAISQQIAALERQAGTKLVDRTPRGVILTDAGRVLVGHAEAVLERLAAAEAELEAMASVRGGRVRLASFPTAGAALVPPAVRAFHERFPEVELSLTEAELDQSIPMLRGGELDLALVFDFEHVDRSLFDRLLEGIELQHLLDDPLYLALAKGHPAASRPVLRAADLAEETWIHEDAGNSTCGRLHLAACEAVGLDPQRVAFQTDDYNVAQGLVAAGVGVALLPALALTNVRDDIVLRELTPSPVRRIALATAAGRHRSPATEAMLAILVDVAGRFRPPVAVAA